MTFEDTAALGLSAVLLSSFSVSRRYLSRVSLASAALVVLFAVGRARQALVPNIMADVTHPTL